MPNNLYFDRLAGLQIDCFQVCCISCWRSGGQAGATSDFSTLVNACVAGSNKSMISMNSRSQLHEFLATCSLQLQ